MKNLNKTGKELLLDPRGNKGTSFTMEEREKLGLLGLLPPRVFSQETKMIRVLKNFQDAPTDIGKYVFLTALQDRNESLFYRFVIDNINEAMPIIYTPTVGEACIKYSQVFRRPRGVFISINDKGKIKNILRNWNEDDIRMIVVTDGERILGLGDLGANGMGIPTGKLALYTACGGIDPSWCLPISIDVGTNNENLIDDPVYIGLQQKRVRGQEYDELLDEFFHAVKEVYPKAVIQLEDFGNVNAFKLLNKYRHDFCTFDDDIQGTAAVALSGIYTASKLSGSSLKDQKILFLGAGEAGIGIGDLIVSALEAEGISKEEGRAKCWFFDSKGLVVKSRTDLVEHKKHFAHDFDFTNDFKEAIEKLRPTAIIGVSGQPQSFTKEMIELMSEINQSPIIFALSNPTSKSECTAEQAYSWSKNRAIFASGSPFEALIVNGKRVVPGQCNNAYIFPGVGLGVILSGVKIITDEMFCAAAKELANQVTEIDLSKSRIFPSLKRIRDVSAHIATAVANVAFDSGLANIEKPGNLFEYIKSKMYDPID
ncbi:MAG: NAD-dependent malic enzyme [Cyanobacteriota bacterium]